MRRYLGIALSRDEKITMKWNRLYALSADEVIE
jgi:hypothetical protein